MLLRSVIDSRRDFLDILGISTSIDIDIQRSGWNIIGSYVLPAKDTDHKNEFIKNFGESLDINSDGSRFVAGGNFRIWKTMAYRVSAYKYEYKDVQGHNVGGVRVYMYNGSTWAQLGETLYGINTISPGYGIGDHIGDEVAMNNIGDIIGYSIPNSDSPLLTALKCAQVKNKKSNTGDTQECSTIILSPKANNVGQIQVLKYLPRTGTSTKNWNQIGKGIYGVQEREGLGSTLIMNGSGTRVAVTSPGFGQNPPLEGSYNGFRGKVGIYEINPLSAIHDTNPESLKNAEWVQVGTDIEGRPGFYDRFGDSLAFNEQGDIIAIGCPYANQYTGSVRVYQHKNNDIFWTQIGSDITLKAPVTTETGALRGVFGYSVSLNAAGNRIAIGAPSYIGVGAVQVFDLKDGKWVSAGQILSGAPSEVSSVEFGRSVSLNAAGDILAVGSPSRHNYGYNKFLRQLGEVRTFKWSNGQWARILSTPREGQLRAGFDKWNASFKSLYEERFGNNVRLSKDGGRLIISAPGFIKQKWNNAKYEGPFAQGKVEAYKLV